MQVLYERCAGLDVHKDNVVARVRCVSEPKHDEVKSFATTTSALLDLKDWLDLAGGDARGDGGDGSIPETRVASARG